MILARSVDMLTGFAPRPELQQICKFGAHWASDHVAEAGRWMRFHFVTQGVCVVELNNIGGSIRIRGATVRHCSTGAANYAGVPEGGRRAQAIRVRTNRTNSALTSSVAIASASVRALSSCAWITDVSMQRRDATDPLAAAETIIRQAKEEADDAITK